MIFKKEKIVSLFRWIMFLPAIIFTNGIVTSISMFIIFFVLGKFINFQNDVYKILALSIIAFTSTYCQLFVGYKIAPKYKYFAIILTTFLILIYFGYIFHSNLRYPMFGFELPFVTIFTYAAYVLFFIISAHLLFVFIHQKGKLILFMFGNNENVEIKQDINLKKTLIIKILRWVLLIPIVELVILIAYYGFNWLLIFIGGFIPFIQNDICLIIIMSTSAFISSYLGLFAGYKIAPQYKSISIIVVTLLFILNNMLSFENSFSQAMMNHSEPKCGFETIFLFTLVSSLISWIIFMLKYDKKKILTLLFDITTVRHNIVGTRGDID